MLPGRLLAIADLDVLGADLAERAAEAAAGGVGWVLVRAKGSGAEAAADLVRRIAARCPDLALSVHGYAGARRETGCRGLHLPAGPLGSFHGGEPAETVVGVSCHDGAELGRAAAEGADYAFLSPVFPPAPSRCAVSSWVWRDSVPPCEARGFRSTLSAESPPRGWRSWSAPERRESRCAGTSSWPRT